MNNYIRTLLSNLVSIGNVAICTTSNLGSISSVSSMRKYGICQETELPMNETDRSYGKEPKPFSQTETSSSDSSGPTPTRKMAWICRSSRSSSSARPISPYLPTLRGACTPRNCGPVLLEALCKVEMRDSPAALGFRCGRPLSGTCVSLLE
jgi:hypothetical protein